MNPCQGCGFDLGDENPPASEHCGQCPPWACEDCGQLTSAPGTEPGLCPCWISLDGMPLADIKALFASAAPELSIDPDGSKS